MSGPSEIRSTDSPRRRRVARPSAATLLTAGLLGLSGLLTAGCNGTQTPDSPPAQAPPAAAGPPVIPLSTVLDSLQPDELEFSVPRDLGASQLNEWGQNMLVDMLDPAVDEDALKQRLREYVDETTADRALRRRYVLRDATHVRDMLWAQRLFRTILADAPADLDSRVVRLFDHVAATVLPLNLPLRDATQTDPWLPLGPFESAYFGHGRPEDRAWAFALLLAQLRIPAAVLELPAVDGSGSGPAASKPSGGATVPSLLVGVLLDERVLLFDAALGLAVPGPDDGPHSVLPVRPATLAQAVNDDSLLRRFDLDGGPAYPVTAGRLKQARVRIIGDSSFWSRRMEGLQNALTGESSVILAELPVSDGSPDSQGTIEQFRQALDGLIPADQVGLWTWPEQQREARETLTDAQKTLLAGLSVPFDMPLPMTVSFPGGPGHETEQPPQLAFGTGWKRLQLARIHQLLGQTAEAIPIYLKLQSWGLMPPSPEDVSGVPAGLHDFVRQHIPPQIQAAHRLAAEQAFFWRATCQFQKRNFAAAATDLEQYLTQTIRGSYSGQLAADAALLCGIALAEDGRVSRGAAFLGRVRPDDPGYFTARILERRWKSSAPPE